MPRTHNLITRLFIMSYDPKGNFGPRRDRDGKKDSRNSLLESDPILLQNKFICNRRVFPMWERDREGFTPDLSDHLTKITEGQATVFPVPELL